MALLTYGNQTVDDRFSALVEPNLYDNQVFQPGVTFSNKYQMDAAGQILIHKLGKETLTESSPGSDFSNTDTADTQIILPLDKRLAFSKKLFGATVGAVAYPIAAAQMEMGVRDMAEAFNLAAMATLEASFTAGAVTTALTGANVFDIVVDDRKILVNNGAKADAMIVSPETYAALLKSPEFQRTGHIGDEVVSNAMVGRIANMNVFEYQGTATLTDYVMYDHEALNIVPALNMLRTINAIDFNGVLAQGELIYGRIVSNTSRVLKKVHT